MMSHKNKPLRCADPAPPLMSSSEDTDPAYMPAVSYTKTRNTWRESKCADDSAVPALQTGNLPPHREGQRIPNGRYPALVLNADYQPLSYVPLSLWSWQDTVRAVFRGSVTVLSEYDVTVRSPSCELQLPSVIVLKRYIGHATRATPLFTRRNLFLRDKFTCQYCHKCLPTDQLTYDHVVPRSRAAAPSSNSFPLSGHAPDAPNPVVMTDGALSTPLARPPALCMCHCLAGLLAGRPRGKTS